MSTNIAFLGQPVLTWLPGDNVVQSVVIFLHGSGDTGPGVAEWVEALGVRGQAVGGHTAVVFPSARERPYSMMGGLRSSVWHDRWVWPHLWVCGAQVFLNCVHVSFIF